MVKPISELTKDWSPERKARVEARVQELLREMERDHPVNPVPMETLVPDESTPGYYPPIL